MISIVSKGSIRLAHLPKHLSQRAHNPYAKLNFNSLPACLDLNTTGSNLIQTYHFSEKTEVRPVNKSLGSYLRAFSQITKVKLGVLNTFVTFTTYLIKGGTVCLFDCTMLAAATQMMAMSSQTVNQIIEVEHDKAMKRTRSRPLPQGKFTKNQAWMIAGSLYAGSNLILGSMFPMSSVFVANSIFWSYILCYTPMKRTSELNTPVGAVIGSLTAYLGWAAAGGSMLSLTPFCIFFYTFSWQFAHFYGILWTYKGDYNAAGFKMIQDAQKACKIMKAALAGQIASVAGIFHVGAIDPASAALSLYLLYKFNYKPMKEFEKEDTAANAKRLTIFSYIPFTTLFFLIYLNLCAKTFGFEKKMDEIFEKYLPKALQRRPAKESDKK
mmetsp:Transcript_71848/g.83516  ORF Transcript_71848/g.83516 Transcript_71848/m.83516 type:complete len:382 (+) Transcript_71848:29-1174(+)|eukprot:CAMPEP_0176447180 /NCGR_PEP_ID=MMETSP0127-20121128/24851_1 /TAXON_ID=938130 /ORGANISM="Platyophrya macrostoma, Strain WH" /LENGTH=381 /DNA_ID=CAMNT_0017833523 /DNA_START=29 /DNA_END=1174 /DNA_ORIENTATION=+